MWCILLMFREVSLKRTWSSRFGLEIISVEFAFVLLIQFHKNYKQLTLYGDVQEEVSLVQDGL